MSIQWNYFRATKLLIQHCADGINLNRPFRMFPNEPSLPPLHRAVVKGHSETVELLLSVSEVDINAKVAAFSLHTLNNPFDLSSNAYYRPPRRIPYSVRALLIDRLDSANGDHGWTPLHLAVIKKKTLHVLKVLVSAPRLDANVSDGQGTEYGIPCIVISLLVYNLCLRVPSSVTFQALSTLLTMWT